MAVVDWTNDSRLFDTLWAQVCLHLRVAQVVVLLSKGGKQIAFAASRPATAVVPFSAVRGSVAKDRLWPEADGLLQPFARALR
ncbi:hypothetical protein WK66_03125 [Burkholderia ubonensis]|nr:hypothetical protein WJ76_02990 [Burkholderia ubonensis]KVU12849.1 hypothetical protein WK62_33915 [Burkholderia ubonensis]KVU33203.1 hypothetical protein WK66_03125 [Burkholderia ubonensis]